MNERRETAKRALAGYLRSKAKKHAGPEGLGAILPRVMAELDEKRKQQRARPANTNDERKRA